jgi:hypothetical protein
LEALISASRNRTVHLRSPSKVLQRLFELTGTTDQFEILS